MSTTTLRVSFLTGFVAIVLFRTEFLAAASEDGDTIRRRAQEVLAKGRYQSSLRFDNASDRASRGGATSSPSDSTTTGYNPNLGELRPLVGVATVLMYVFLTVVVALVAIWIVRVVREKSTAPERKVGGSQLRRVAAGTTQSRPSVQRSEDHLQQADRLAALGKFDEAAHLLLMGAIQYLCRTSPSARKNSYTSRELMQQVQLDNHRQMAFRDIVLAVEQSVFAGRPASKAAYELCRGQLHILRSKEAV